MHLFKEMFSNCHLFLFPPWKHFDTDTQDLTGIEWAPNGCVLAVWDTCLEVYQTTSGLSSSKSVHLSALSVASWRVHCISADNRSPDSSS